LLFLIFINDLVDTVPKLESILFADDTNVFSDNFNDLQTELNKIEIWCLANQLILNSLKTLHIPFKNHQKHMIINPDIQLQINNTPIAIEKHTQFLGIILDENISFNKHIFKLCSKLQYILLMMRYIRRYFDQKTMIDFYYTFFYPHLIYGIEFWGHAGSTVLNKVLILQKRALRIILKIGPDQAVTHQFSILKIMPIQMLFEFRFVLHFINTYSQENINNMIIDHKYSTRLKASNAIKTPKFKTNKGQRSMLYAAAKLFNCYLHDFNDLAPRVVKAKLAERLWAGDGCCADVAVVSSGSLVL